MLKITSTLATLALAAGATFKVTTVAWTNDDCTGTASDAVVVANPYILGGSGRVRHGPRTARQRSLSPAPVAVQTG